MLKKLDAKSHVVEAEAKMRQQEIVVAPAVVVNIKNFNNFLTMRLKKIDAKSHVVEAKPRCGSRRLWRRPHLLENSQKKKITFLQIHYIIYHRIHTLD